MPKFIKEKSNNFYDFNNPDQSHMDDIINKEIYKNNMNEKYDIEICFNFYWKNFIKDPKIFENHNLIGKKLMRISEDYYIASNKNERSQNSNQFSQKFFEEKVKNIFYKNLIPLDPSADNYLFMRFLKFHLGFVQFIQWYEPNGFNRLLIDDILIKDFLLKKFYVCLEKNKRELREKLNTLTDFQLISNVCVKERLTLYNYFIENEVHPTDAKKFINSQYMLVLRNSKRSPDFSNEKQLNGKVKIEDMMQPYVTAKNLI